MYICVNPNLPIHPTPFHLGVHRFVLYFCRELICFTNKFMHFWILRGKVAIEEFPAAMMEALEELKLECPLGELLIIEQRRLLLGRKVMNNLDSILKGRDITLPTKVRLVKAMVFPVVMYGCESWTIKRAEHWRIDAFELWYWKSLGLQGDPTSPS